MEDQDYRKGMPWLILGTLLLVVSGGIYMYDQLRSDSEIFNDIQVSLQDDFGRFLRHYESNPDPDPDIDSLARASHLYYDTQGRLTSWHNNTYMPAYELINRRQYLGNAPVWNLDQRAYYVIQNDTEEGTHAILIPLYITYNVRNQYLQPYMFWGRYHELFYGLRANKNIDYTTAIIGPSDVPAPVIIEDLAGNRVLAYQQLPVEPFRQQDRTAVLVFLVLGIIGLCIYLRIFVIDRWEYRYFINLSLIGGIILFRVLLWVLGFPANYLAGELFSANILAFHFLAPSLGEFTLNVLMLVALVWILYVHFFRMSLKLWRKVMHNHYVAWLTMIAAVGLVVFLGYGYSYLFERITSSSQIDLEFSNIFSADLYAFLILLDVGLLFLIVIFGAFSILKLNILYGQRHGFTPTFWLIHILAALVFTVACYQGEWSLSLSMAFAVVIFLVGVKRFPRQQILHQDMVNYLLMLTILSVVVTVHFNQSLERDRKQKAKRIAVSIIGNQEVHTISSYTRSLERLQSDTTGYRTEFQEAESVHEFTEWVRASYFEPRLKEFDVRIFAFDSSGRRLDDFREYEPSFTPTSDLSPGELGRTVDPSGLYQLMNAENRYVDFYVGEFDLQPAPGTDLSFFLELRPNNREFDGLYPSLTMDQRVYDEIQLINSFDHATYRNGVLYNERGISPFPINLPEHEKTRNSTSRVRDGYHELIQAVGSGNSRHVFVRYPVRGFVDQITTFSFIFYFFVLATIVVIGMPVMALRSLRTRQFTRNLPIRAKIRFGLLSISVLPMIFIMVLLSPFIYHRYEQQAIDELLTETERITNLIGPDYLNFKNDLFSRMTLLQEFRETVESMGKYLRNDVNIYDEEGKPLAASRPLIFEEDISTNLMNSKALAILSRGNRSDIVLEEQIGNKDFFSAYRTIIGKNEEPIGFVNVPYLTKQEDLNAQVTGFLAYLANIYLVVFLLINLVAVLVSGTISAPLRMIQERLQATGLGGRYERIEYQAADEIGSIVSAYNQMISQLEKNEEKIKQNQRELAWRQMARQVAHEIKNPLTPMRLSIQHLNRAWSTGSDKLEEMFPRMMKTLMSQIDTMVRIANSFSEFAKMPEASKSRVLVNEVLHEVVDLYRQTDEIIWLIDIPEEPLFVSADRDQLSRSFNNILKNAIQAMNDNGVIEVTMRNIDEENTRIEIMDNGSGMSIEVQKHVFEPSFSTKNSGMGLGMSMVKKIIENSGGNISFVSEEGKGTTFYIDLPRMPELEQLPVSKPV